MIKIKVRNTYDVRLDGKPNNTIVDATAVKRVGVAPSSISFIKPKLFVTEGDTVKIGTPLFFDKKNHDTIFVSPGSGVISKIEYGPKRRLDIIEITLSEKEEHEIFIPLSIGEIEKASRETLVQTIQKGGLWGLFQELPFRRIPTTDTIPPSIYVTLDNDEPHTPSSSLIFEKRTEDFEFGLAALKQLTENVFVGVSDANEELKKTYADKITHSLEGAYPANEPGVFAYYTKKDQKDNTAWFIKGQELLRIGALLRTGQYPTEQLISLAGSEVNSPCHLKIRTGSFISDVTTNHVISTQVRYIAGGVLTGRKVAQNDCLGFTENAINVIQEGKLTEMLHFFKLGFKRNTKSNAYASALFSKMSFKMSTYLNGSHRSCIACGDCPKVCPVDLLPQYIHKSYKAGDIEDVISHGVLDCAECGLCAYVCPSKIELADDMKAAKAQLEKETHSHEGH